MTAPSFIRTAVCAAFAAVVTPALAAPSDFARGSPLVIVEDSPAQRVRLPADVYTWAVREDLGDLRVLNGAGEELPYTLQVPAHTNDDTEWMPLPVFPLPVDQPGGNGGGSREGGAVDIELGPGGAVVSVRGAIGHVDAGGYLIDASAYKSSIEEIEVSWDLPQRDFLTQVRLDASDDLNTWRTILPSTTLASLETAGQWVKLDRIRLAGVQAKYIKMSFTSDALALTGARVRSKEAKAAPREWITLDGTPADGGFNFDTRGHFPVDRLFVELDRPTFLVDVHLFSRSRDNDPWRDLGHQRFYRAASGDTALTSDPAEYAPILARHWRVVPGQPGETPRLRVGWAPHEVVFVLQGEGPFFLVYGRADVAAREWPIADLLERLGKGTTTDSLPLAQAGQPTMLGGPDRLVPGPKPIDWRTIVLWSVLVIGVAVVGGLAIRLVRGGNTA